MESFKGMDFDNVYVGKSNIHGLGVFAKRKFIKGEQVLIWKPKEITRDELEKLTPEEKTYVSEFGGNLKLMQEPERYVNYSAKNNTTPNSLGDVAIRDIEVDEEITSDYNGEILDFVKGKDYVKWTRNKKMLNTLGVHKWCKEGTVWWCSLGENIGFEEDGKSEYYTRPVLILKTFSIYAVLVLPLTTSKNENKYLYKIGSFAGENSVVILSQIRFVDTKRLTEKMGSLGKDKFLGIKKAIKDLI